MNWECHCTDTLFISAYDSKTFQSSNKKLNGSIFMLQPEQQLIYRSFFWMNQCFVYSVKYQKVVKSATKWPRARSYVVKLLALSEWLSKSQRNSVIYDKLSDLRGKFFAFELEKLLKLLTDSLNCFDSFSFNRRINEITELFRFQGIS